MNRLKAGVLSFASLLLLFFSSQALAGGGPVSFSVYPNSELNPGEQFVVNAQVYDDGPDVSSYCKNCYIKLALKDPQGSDYIAQSSDYTDNDGRIYAKVISKISGDRTVYVESLKNSNGTPMVAYSIVILNYTGDEAPISNQPPSMVYPQDAQVLDLEGAYMFKVNPVNGASGYLFGLFQNGTMLYENYRDEGQLSGTEFALWESNSYHKKFKEGPVKVMVRALVNNQWTDAREITIFLKSRLNQGSVTTSTAKPTVTTKSKPPSIPPSQTVVIVQDSSAAAELEKKVEDLEKQLEESQIKQSELEVRLNQLVEWIKSIFPFFN